MNERSHCSERGFLKSEDKVVTAHRTTIMAQEAAAEAPLGSRLIDLILLADSVNERCRVDWRTTWLVRHSAAVGTARNVGRLQWSQTHPIRSLPNHAE